MEALLDWMAANPQVWAWFTTAVRFLFPVLALLILIRTIRSLLTRARARLRELLKEGYDFEE